MSYEELCNCAYLLFGVLLPHRVQISVSLSDGDAAAFKRCAMAPLIALCGGDSL